MFRLVTSCIPRITQRITKFSQLSAIRAFSTEESPSEGLGVYALGIQRKLLLPADDIDSIVEFQVGPHEKRMLAVTDSGTLLVKGEGSNGELGLGKVTSTEEWTPVEGLPPVVSAKFGEIHTMALTEDGDVYTWGSGGSFFKAGALGQGSTSSLDRPKRIGNLSKIKQIATGQRHSLALDDEGKVYSWGLGEFGRLGHGSSSTYNEPALIEALAGLETHQIGCGNSFSAAATNEGIFTWGKNDRGQLGLKQGVLFEMYNMEAIPTPVQFPDEPPVNEVPSTVDVISCSPRSCFAYRSETGETYFWGDKIWTLPTKLELKDVKMPILGIAHGNNRSVILDSDHVLHTWTRNMGIKRLGEATIIKPTSDAGKILKVYSGHSVVYLLDPDFEDYE